MTPERDYSGGVATALWKRALERGALLVDDEERALIALLRLLEEDGLHD
jgi:hypothetical protein